MNISDAITELGRLLGQQDLTLSDAGTCRLTFDGRLPVDIEALPDGRTLHLSSVVSVLDLESEQSLRALLSANRLGTGTGGASFSLSPDAEILLEHRLDMEQFDLTAFANAMETFVNYVDGWEDRLSSGELTATTSAATA